MENTATTPEQMRRLLTATTCCICRRALTDAESVQLGIGPDCSRRYYSPSVFPTEKDIENALGVLVAGMDDGLFPAEIVAHLASLKGDARVFTNTLVLYTSANGQRNVVLAAARAIRYLGYTGMADKLEIDRVKARIQKMEDDDAILLTVIRSARSAADLRSIPGVTETSEKEGAKAIWRVPASEEEHLLVVLGVHFGGGLMIVAGRGIFQITRKSPEDLHRFRHLRQSPNSHDHKRYYLASAIWVDVGPDFIFVRTPFEESYLTALKEAVPPQDRTWVGCWRIRSTHLERVKNLLKDHFGADFDAAQETPEFKSVFG